MEGNSFYLSYLRGYMGAAGAQGCYSPIICLRNLNRSALDAAGLHNSVTNTIHFGNDVFLVCDQRAKNTDLFIIFGFV